jgi:hypothetical protein
MYRFNLDANNKVIYIELSGSISLEEINACINDLRNLASNHSQRMYSILFITQKLDPFSQVNLPAIQHAFEIALNWANKIAFVYGNRTITRMQLRRIESYAREKLNSDTPVLRTTVLNDAMTYLNSNK